MDASAARPVVTVKIAAVLADLFPGAPREFIVQAQCVGEMIDALDQQFPGMGDRIRDSRPAIRKHMNVFVDGERATLDTPLSHRDEVFVITAISGG
jgi:sulfur-carrier protein